jgi:hypothetical protein|tara:strand:+ start:615 stop:776 length:162 start_codon:yes stop_codon:yes gene_type:complete
MKLTNEQIQDVVEAVTYYQIHHLSIKNPRYNEFSNILNLLIEQSIHENISRHS